MSLRTLLFGLCCLSSVAAAGGCNEVTPSKPPSCLDTPTACDAGTTCWPTDRQGGSACLVSKPYAVAGTECEPIVGATTCADGLACITSEVRPDAGMVTSYCAPFCTATGGGCPAGQECRQVELAGKASAQACINPSPRASDGGADM